MAVLLTGDLHGRSDIDKLGSWSFPEGDDLTRDDYLIICGDFGLVWDFTPEELHWREWLDHKPWTTLFVDGNHENHDALAQMPLEQWHGGLVHRVGENTLHLCRGQVFDMDGVSVFTMGGATSIDRHVRREGETWWTGELPTDEQLHAASEVLADHDWHVDYVVTHCCSSSLLPLVYGDLPVWQGRDRLTDWFDAVEHRLDYRRWYFGHHHMDKNVDDWHRCLYKDIIELGE